VARSTLVPLPPMRLWLRESWSLLPEAMLAARTLTLRGSLQQAPLQLPSPSSAQHPLTTPILALGGHSMAPRGTSMLGIPLTPILLSAGHSIVSQHDATACGWVGRAHHSTTHQEKDFDDSNVASGSNSLVWRGTAQHICKEN
jgi:hypothetical protein